MINTTAYPTITILKERTIHARLTHRCSCCSLPIQRSEEHRYYVIADEDAPRGSKLRTIRTHLRCPRP